MKWVLMFGDLHKGYNLVGPFGDPHQAAEWAVRELSPMVQWQVLPVAAP